MRDHLGGLEIRLPDGRPTGYGFGLGFGVIRDPTAAGYISSEGTFFWAGAADTLFWVDPKEDLVVVAMTQYLGASPMTRLPLGPELNTLVYSAITD
jgi:CubicO group peptidase (beta-lactamase class C family)